MMERAGKFAAAFELMYATGMRVSEVCQLKDNQVDLMRVSCACWEGNKERVVPFGRHAKRLLPLSRLRDSLRKKTSEGSRRGFCFISSHGGAMSRATFLKELKKWLGCWFEK